MIRHADLLCAEDLRRQQIIASPLLQGIDYVEIVTEPDSDDQRVLLVFFLPKSAPNLPALIQLLDTIVANHAGLVSITGGVRIRDVAIIDAARDNDHLRIRVNHPGDFSNYRLAIEPPPPGNVNDPVLDPAYASVEFNFKAACPSQFDCRQDASCVPEPTRPPPIDYLAKDYASFRQALLDRITEIQPDWNERSPADLGIALVELLAYAGDQLSYYQDAVANEAWLETARQRISVRRHARLVSYQMHDGLSAVAFVRVPVEALTGIPAGTAILTRIAEPLIGSAPPPAVIGPALREKALAAADVVYETREAFQLRKMDDALEIHDWGRRGCCLPIGSVSADLKKDLLAALEPGDLLLFEEIRGVTSGDLADADRSHRQVVRITARELVTDPAASLTLTRVHWDSADALTFPLCVTTSAGLPAAVARGNIIVAHQGKTVSEWHPESPGPDAKGIVRRGRPYRFQLLEGPLSFRPRFAADAPVAEMLNPGVRNAEPEIVHLAVHHGPDVLAGWIPRPDLLSSGPDDRHFVVETDNFGRALIRFGDGVMGVAPPNGSLIEVKYRIGVGAPGHVARESLHHVIDPGGGADLSAVQGIRNPLPSWGAVDPEPIEIVKLTAPEALRSEMHRAVTEADYARIAEKSPDVSHAVATFRWTGSWHTVSLTIDPKGSTELAAEQRERVLALVRQFSQLGYDLRVESPAFLPLEIEIAVCVDPAHFRADVEEDIALELSNRVLSAGRLGFFHPDRFTFGQTLYVSEIYAAVTSVEGVRSATVTKLQRQGADPNGELERGFIAPGRREILRLDNDRNFPENGILQLVMGGGK